MNALIAHISMYVSRTLRCLFCAHPDAAAAHSAETDPTAGVPVWGWVLSEGGAAALPQQRSEAPVGDIASERRTRLRWNADW